MSKERVHRFVSKDLTLRIAAVNASEVVKHMQSLQNTYPIASVAVGRSMVGALLMASQLKDGQMVGLLFRGNGALQSVYAEASFEGHVRGYTPNPQYQPPNYDNGLSLKEALGNGTLSVARHQPFQKQPFHGTVELVSGEIGQDIAHYLHQSHQIRSLVALGVYLDTNGKVETAGGVLIEVMPGVEESVVELIQKNYDEKKPNISKMLLDGAQPIDLVKPFMEGIEFEELPHDYPIEYYCPCTQERVIRALETLGEEELQDMITKKEDANVTCQICGKPYVVTVAEISSIKDRVHKESMH
ncbi:Hsp33 family molecular chaperone HslO [Bdellovibrio reynosensis]|uniref:Hsp33 family molecular chaperone HslO n=1 Tax=Bdellovibrio reynosensis TaxID=2835041 RepID=A0ABY4CFI1_9BACT|nr:Hsp33 family molecular chaperone HslO [Bdellovibrio reynosensis]UOF02642.1 Hsp33 family molecular chaperone HslO [Bdellovibrio reynosensis]